MVATVDEFGKKIAPTITTVVGAIGLRGEVYGEVCRGIYTTATPLVQPDASAGTGFGFARCGESNGTFALDPSLPTSHG